MPLTSTDEATLDRVLGLISQRADSYQTGVQTSVCWKAQSGWLNAITKLDFVSKLGNPPSVFRHEYRDLVIVRRLLSHIQVGALLKRLLDENRLEIGYGESGIGLQSPGTFSIGGKIRQPHSEWSVWPADIFTIHPTSGYQGFPPDEPLIAVDAPYYPSLEKVLWDFFGIRVQSWMQYLQGQVAVVLPDFRARIAKLVIALAYLRADFECLFLQPTDLVVKVYAESRIGRLVQETIHPEEPFLQLDLTDKPSLVSVALVCAATGEALDEKVFREGVSWREPNVVVEPLGPEIEQILLTGESETVEFREKLDKTRPQRLAKTAVAFANTKGGAIVFGVDDDHRIVGCEIQGMADTITNILRSLCDPPPAFTTKVVKHENKELFLVQVAESSAVVHVVKELGPFIRANGTNRAPTSHELELLFRRGGSELGFPSFLR